ncbi:unnamed protein product [Candida verbasci]|uniref:Histidinol-phosphatase n=1 Tax=Candida verbasci TaxID=1227364 RepID=A0A9W4XFG4_9ASCO|nr:unnamed protein product [Candida verbasci]
MVDTYYQKGFKLVCLTEHMPRLNNRFLYPEEIEKSYTITNLNQDFENYLNHAKELQKKYEGKMRIVIGFEVEAINKEHIQFAKELASKFELMIGSIHFVKEIPIDFDKESWNKARDSLGSQRLLFKEYFKLQQQLIIELKPKVIGHFDLIRLFQDEDVDLKTWPEVGQRLILKAI